MKIKLIRDYFTETTTLGKLYIDGKFFCHTLEDKVRPDEEKVYGKTAIPEGIYRIIVSFSKRFQRMTLEILDVPNFSGIRIHGGNTHKDTLGCILVGFYCNNQKETIWATAEKNLLETVKILKYENSTIEITRETHNTYSDACG
jgi:hypothetical protein